MPVALGCRRSGWSALWTLLGLLGNCFQNKLPCVLSSHVIECQLKPSGVCDGSKAGVEQQGLRGTWLSF